VQVVKTRGRAQRTPPFGLPRDARNSFVGRPILAAAGFQPALFASFFCIAGALFAQPPDKPADQWIHSPEPLKQAWAAHWIAEQKLTALIPELLRVVESPETSADVVATDTAAASVVATDVAADVATGIASDASAAKFAALDTLIQLNAEVPLRDLEPLADRFPTDVLILASRSSEDASALLLKLLDRQHNREAFIAVGDLLTPKRNAGFAKDAMKEFCQSATVYVFNPDQPRGMGEGWAGDMLGKTDPPRADWPDTGSYRLAPGTGNRRQAWTLLADGPHPVSFVRTANKGYTDHGFDFSGDESGNNSCLRAEEFLAQYLETSTSQLPVRADTKLDLAWTSPEAFEAAVRGFIAEQRVRYASLGGQLAARGYLTVDEASKARLNLRIQAADVRTHDRTPLPFINDWVKDPPL
jgi:hypothetical protein